MSNRPVLDCVRQPMQERGARRVTAILDAAAELVGESGLEALTVQALAERAQTSKGSLYHFFPDMAAVVRALADRHLCVIRTTISADTDDPDVDWAAMSVHEAVSRFLAPLEYLHAHPDLLAIIRAPMMVDRSAQRMEPMRQLAERMLSSRDPSLSLAERRVRAATMVAMVDGVVGYVARCGDVSFSAMRSELARALASYLETPRAQVAIS